jgi:cell division protein FtsA
MSEKNFDAYIDFGSSKIRAGVFSKIEQKKIYFTEHKCSNNLKNNKLNLLSSENIVKKTILEIEKKTNEYLNDINLMIDSPDSLLVTVSRSKNIEGKKLKKEEIEYLIQDTKQQIIKSYKDKHIIHILVTNYNVNGNDYNFIPLNINCNHFYVDIAFICFPKEFVKNLEELFSKNNIAITRIMSSSYAKALSYKKKIEIDRKVLFVDIGYEKTSIIFYNKEIFSGLNILPIGGNHISKDISKILHVPLEKAEEIKLNFDKNEFKNTADLIKKIVFARIEEILELSVSYLPPKEKKNGLNQIKLILMGDGSKILDTKFKDSISFSSDIDLLEESTQDICECGLNLNKGISHQEVAVIPKKLEKKGFFERLFHFFK